MAPAGGGFAERLATTSGEEVSRPERVEGPHQIEDLDRTNGPGRTDGLAGLEDIARQVDRGEVSAEQAVEQVVERVLDAQLPPGADAGLRQRVRSLVEASLRSDPLLGALVRRLEGAR